MYFCENRPLKLLIAGLYLTVALAAGFFHMHHGCGSSHLACDHDCCSVDAASEAQPQASSCCCTHDHDTPKPKSSENDGKEETPLPAAGDQDSRHESLSDSHCCPICSFLAQKLLNTECPRVPVWAPLCGEREDTFTPPSITTVSFSWLSRAPPVDA